MKIFFPKSLFLSIILLLSIGHFSNAQVDITFKVKGISDTTCLLAYRFGSRVFVKDSIVFNNKGVGNLNRDKLYGSGVYMMVLPDKQDFIEFLMGSDQEFVLSTDTADLVGKMEVEGSSGK